MDMWISVACAVVTGALTLVGVIITNSKSRAVQDANTDKKIDLLAVKLDNSVTNINLEVKTLRTEVERHNSIIDRVYKCESRLDVLDQKHTDLSNDVAEIKKQFPSV